VNCLAPINFFLNADLHLATNLISEMAGRLFDMTIEPSEESLTIH
jgi:hypothetical protein